MGVAGDKSWWWGFIQQKTKPVQPVGKMLLVDYVDVGVHSCTEGRGNIQCGTIVTRVTVSREGGRGAWLEAVVTDAVGL